MSHLKIEDITLNYDYAQIHTSMGSEMIPIRGEAKNIVNAWLAKNPSVKQILEYKPGQSNIYLLYTKEIKEMSYPEFVKWKKEQNQ